VGVAAECVATGRTRAICRHPRRAHPGPEPVHSKDLEIVVHRVGRGPVTAEGGAMTLEAWMAWKRCVGIDAERRGRA